MTNFLYGNDEFFTVHNKYSKIPLTLSMHFANRLRRSRVIRGIFEHLFLNVTKCHFCVTNPPFDH